jgi:hypothetical protein
MSDETPMRTWEDNAEEYKQLDQGEGWPFAVLVACSVARVGTGHGHADIGNGKVNANRFAGKAGTHRNRVIRHFDAWQRAAKQGLVPDADTLKPEDAREVKLPDIPWSKNKGGFYYGGTNVISTSAVETIKNVLAARHPKTQAKIVAETLDNPEVATEVGKIRQANLDPDRLIQVTLPLALQQKVMAMANEEGLTYRYTVIALVREGLKQETPRPLGDDVPPPLGDADAPPEDE